MWHQGPQLLPLGTNKLFESQQANMVAAHVNSVDPTADAHGIEEAHTC